MCVCGVIGQEENLYVKMLETESRGPDPAVRRLARAALWNLGLREAPPAATAAAAAAAGPIQVRGWGVSLRGPA